MVDSGFPVDVVSKDIYWIDEDRVLFRGVVLAPGRGPLETAHVWDTKQNKVEPYGNSQKGLRYFCSNKGYVSYVWQGKIYAGAFGKEEAVAAARPMDSFSQRNPYSCKPYAGLSEFDSWRKQSGRAGVQLLEEHGWLDVSGSSNIVLYRDSKSPVVETSIPRQAGPIEVRYIPWTNQYLVTGNTGSGGKTYPAWYLRPDGSSIEIKWPDGEWQVASDYLPTRRGLLVWARKGTDPSTYVYGHFLLRGGAATRIAWGYYWKGTSVSPDGCKVAFRHSLNREDEARGDGEWKAGRPANTLRMIDVCEPARAARS